MARLFVAIDFPDDIVFCLQRCQPRPQAGIRLITRSQLHLTLHFLGDCSVEQTNACLRPLQIPSFDLTIKGVGRFVQPGGTTILWAGVQENSALTSLHRLVAETLSGTGFRPEARPFTPHVTLARCDGTVDDSVIQSFLAAHRDLLLQDVKVRGITLYSSVLSDSGPTYKCELAVSCVVPPV